MTTDATQVTGSPHAGASARPGDVLAERYELLEAIDVEGPSIGYRALDQETERTVLVRTLVGPPLDAATLADVVERLRGLIGVGGRFLSPLLDADREGRRPFTVEPWPSGTPLSAILHARRARGEGLAPREVLPIAARLSAAIGALPRGVHHGDVRAERVWVDTEGFRLTGAFLLSALPGRALAERMASIGPAAVAYAPEMMSGRGGPAADRWGAAALVWEALTLRAPDRTSTPRELSPSVVTALRRLLDPEPGRRPADLRSLLDALARQAGLPVPELDPEPHAPPVALPDDTAKHAPVTDLDPRLVRAALGITLDSQESGEEILQADPSDQQLDPRLVRAALGVVSDEIEELDELASEELELASEPSQPAVRRPAPAPAARPRPSPEAAARPAEPVARPAQPAEIAPPEARPRAAQGHDGGTAVIPRPVEPPPSAPAKSGALIVVGAIILAIAIVGLGFVVRSWLHEERSSAERSRQIQERLERIRSGEPAENP